MRRVLMDATTWVLATDLVRGAELPNAVNVFDLAIVVETLILHDDIVVLNTYPPDSDETGRLEAALSWIPEGIVAIEQASPLDLMLRYVRLQHPEYGDAALSLSANVHEVERVRDGIHEAEAYIYKGPPSPPQAQESSGLDWGAIARGAFALFVSQGGSAGSDDCHAPADPDDLNAYLEYLRSIHRDVISVRERSWIEERLGARPRTGKMLDQLPLGKAIRAVTTRPSTHDPLVTYKRAGSIFREVNSLQAYGDVTGGSPHVQWELANRRHYQEFATALVLRAHFYLMASEVLDAPYKSDALRWPICWKRFGGQDWRGVAAGDRAVQLVEELEAARFAPLEFVMDKGAIHLRMPFFLRAILSTSTRPGDVFADTVKIRDSEEAQRFRAHWRQLGEDLADHRLEEALKGASTYSGFLTRKYGGGKSATQEVLYSLLAKPTMTLSPAPQFSAPVALGEVAAKSTMGFTRWWRERRFALISKSMKQLRDAKSLNGELHRLFGAPLDAGLLVSPDDAEEVRVEQ